MSDLVERIGRHFQVTKQLRMGADWPIAATEINRYSRTKWLTLPVTFPFVPEVLRRGALDLVHSFMDKLKPQRESEGSASYGFDESDFHIAENPTHSMNLVLVAKIGRASCREREGK